MVEEKNEAEWKIPEVLLPPRREMDRGNDPAIEVDPYYLLEDEDDF